MRDIETIDSELQLLVAIRRMVREEEGRTPSTRPGAEPMPVRAALRRPRHPRSIGAADKLADCGHETNHPSDIGYRLARREPSR